jgi:hypothetical protein
MPVAARTDLISVDVVLAHDNGARIVSSLARCPLCSGRFADEDAVLRIRDLAEATETHLHRSCLERLFDASPSTGVTDKVFQRYRKMLLSRSS